MTFLSLFHRPARPEPARSRYCHPAEPVAPENFLPVRKAPISPQRYQAADEEDYGTLTDRVLTFLDKRSA
jgi:hypothetical protein